MRTIFTLASGRSGTRFLHELITRNARDCVSKHEPYLTNPSMFGRAIYAHATGDQRYVRELLAKKRKVVAQFEPKTYVETSHAFLKSWFDLAPEYFPDTQAVHLMRHPFAVARSFVNREAFIRKLRVPFTTYRGDDAQPYFYWTLTGLEPIFRLYTGRRLSRFQWYLLEWIEIENRAARFLALRGGAARCVRLRVPEDINDASRLRDLFDQLGLEARGDLFDQSGFRNATPGRPTRIGALEMREAGELLARLPDEHLAIFRTEAYAACDWAELLTSRATTLGYATAMPPRMQRAASA
ncbi:MAG: hypothetical protein ABW252_04890 [Polyangiales bacterium]